MYKPNITYGFYIKHLGKTICETIQMPPQVRHTKVRDIQIPPLEIQKSYCTYTTTCIYMHWPYMYIDTRVHCASVDIMYTVALIGKSSTKTSLLVIGNTSVDTCVWPGPFDSIFDVSPVRSVHVSNQWNIETPSKLRGFSSIHTVTAEGPRVSQLTAQRVCEVGIFLQVWLIRAIGAIVDDFCENLGYSKQKKAKPNKKSNLNVHIWVQYP